MSEDKNVVKDDKGEEYYPQRATKPTKLFRPWVYEAAETVKSAVKKAKGGMVSPASKRADGIAVKGKTRGRMV